MYFVVISRGIIRWPSGLERTTDNRDVLGSNPASATSLLNFGNSVYLTLPVSFCLLDDKL